MAGVIPAMGYPIGSPRPVPSTPLFLFEISQEKTPTAVIGPVCSVDGPRLCWSEAVSRCGDPRGGTRGRMRSPVDDAPERVAVPAVDTGFPPSAHDPSTGPSTAIH